MDEFGRTCPDDDGNTHLIGDYIVSHKVGYGSFAVVWKARHRTSGETVAIKEIDKKFLEVKVKESLIKEISILRNLNHPHIVRLLDAFETGDKIFLILEYCDGGDLGKFLHRYGRVTVTVARQLMRQLAAGLHVLQEHRLIHRDLKPQNLLLSNTNGPPVLKIGDFGFARSLTHDDDLAATLCGSPLYMAPEVFNKQKYGGKADLWSVGAILFQLVIGRPPFNGDSQTQLFENVMASTKLQFPGGTFEELHPDCVDLCRRLLCQNPVERLSFEEFFNHKFFKEPREMVVPEESPLLSQTKLTDEQSHFLPSDTRPNMCSNTKNSLINPDSTNLKLSTSGLASTSIAVSVDNIEEEYVLVNSHIVSKEISFTMAPSIKETPSIQTSLPSQINEQVAAVAVQANELPICTSSPEIPKKHQSYDSDQIPICVSTLIKEVEGLTILHPLTRLQLLDQFAQAIAELAQKKYDAGLVLEAFSVKLVVLAVWEKACQISSSWLAASSAESGSSKTGFASKTSLIKELQGPTLHKEENVDFSSPSSVNTWTNQRFILACDRAEELSEHVQCLDGASEMPDSMDLIFKEALEMGKSGAVDEYMGNKAKAISLYSKAMLLFKFLLQEAEDLRLNPPLSLTHAVRKQIEKYIVSLIARITHIQMPESSSKHTKYARAK